MTADPSQQIGLGTRCMVTRGSGDRESDLADRESLWALAPLQHEGEDRR